MTIAAVLGAWLAISAMVSLALGPMIRRDDEIVVHDGVQYYASRTPAVATTPRLRNLA